MIFFVVVVGFGFSLGTLVLGLGLLHSLGHVFELGGIGLVGLDDFFGTAHPWALAEDFLYIFGEDYLLLEEQLCQLAVTLGVLVEQFLARSYWVLIILSTSSSISLAVVSE